MADVQIIGDDIFYNRVKVAVLLPGLETTPRGEFCELIASGLDEAEIKEREDHARTEGEADGKRSMIENFRENLLEMEKEI